MPEWGEFFARRQVARRAFARVVKVHWDKGNLVRIVERFIRHIEPLPKFLAAGVVPWDVTGLSSSAWCLANDNDPRALGGSVYGSVAKFFCPFIAGMIRDFLPYSSECVVFFVSQLVIFFIVFESSS